MNRPTILTGAGAIAVPGAVDPGQRPGVASRHADAAASARRTMDLAATGPERLAELGRLATLDPNRHTTRRQNRLHSIKAVLVATIGAA